MTNSKIPPPNQRALRAIQGGRARRDPTVEFDLNKEVIPTKTVAVGTPPPTRDAVEMEIPIYVETPDPFAALEEQTFEANVVIRNETQSRGPKYYEILTGYALLKADTHERNLGPGEFIGLLGFTRVVSTTELRVRIYDLPKLAAAGNPALHIAAMGRLFAASADQATALERTSQELRQKNREVAFALESRLDEFKEQALRPLRRKLREMEEENSMLHEEIGRLRKDREADLASGHLSLAGLEELVEIQYVDDHERRLARLIAIVSEALHAMSVSSDPNLSKLAFHALSTLFTFKMTLPSELIRKRPAT